MNSLKERSSSRETKLLRVNNYSSKSRESMSYQDNLRKLSRDTMSVWNLKEKNSKKICKIKFLASRLRKSNQIRNTIKSVKLLRILNQISQNKWLKWREKELSSKKRFKTWKIKTQSSSEAMKMKLLDSEKIMNNSIQLYMVIRLKFKLR